MDQSNGERNCGRLVYQAFITLCFLSVIALGVWNLSMPVLVGLYIDHRYSRLSESMRANGITGTLEWIGETSRNWNGAWRVRVSGLSNRQCIALVQTLKGVNINMVEIHASPIDDNGLWPLTELRTLQNLTLDDCSNISNEGMKPVSDIRSLRILTLAKMKVDSGVLKHFHRMQHLQELHVVETNIDVNGIAKLRAVLPGSSLFLE